MHEIEPWQLYPMPAEQVQKIRQYVARREQLAIAEHAAEIERLQLLLDHAEQYARDLQDGGGSDA